MPEPRERLFRDDTGALVERSARLEEENELLRRELQRIRRPDRDGAATVRTRKPNPGLAAVAVALASIFALFLVGGMMPRRHPHVRYEAPRPVAVRMPAPEAHVIGASTPAPVGDLLTNGLDDTEESSCAPPFWYDDSGVKHYKRQCLHPARAAR